VPRSGPISTTLQLLEPDRGDGEASYFIRQDGSALRMWVDAALAIDVDRFDTEVRAARDAEASGAPSVALEHHQAAVALARGEFLADLPNALWADLERERLRSLAVRSAVRAGELLTAADRPDDAIRFGQRALELDEWSERAYLVLARAALLSEDRSAARRAVLGAREMLAELGVEASNDLVAVERRLREGPSA
jgi:LuxR family transcriptional regulator, maltose regulon positive regulatory protein